LPEIQENLQKMEELQYRMYAENKHSLLIVLQDWTQLARTA